MQRFLEYCVEAVLRGDAPKEYAVGTAVFDRKADYDPRVDPIVRVEARRLREKLEEYYSDSGASDEVVVSLPKGSYVPVLETRTAPSAEAATSIAVLPFSNMSRSEDDYFSDGLTEELIHRLTRVEGLRVLAWQSAARLRGRDDDSAIHNQLNIGFILRGSVRRGAGGVRVTAQLVDAASSEIRWSEGYDRALSDLLPLQDEIANSIVSTLRLKLGKRSKPGAANAESHNLCLKGRYLAGRRTVDSIRKSVDCYRDAVAADPHNAVAYAGLADGLSLLAEYAGVPPAATMEEAREQALRALELDPLLAEAHVALAMIRTQYEWNWLEGGRLYRKAIELNPGYARARHWYGLDYLAMLGQWREASAEIEAARRLNPLSAIILEARGYLAMLQRDYDRAIGEMRALLDFEPGFQKGHAGIGRILTLQGRYHEALEAFERASQFGEFSPSLLGAKGQVHGLLGQRDLALECLRNLEDLAIEKSVPRAIVHLGLGDYERALELARQAADRREPNATSFGVHPVWDPLRGEARFQAILRRIGFLP